eukprot:2060882-Amphidinium_carterae.1
MNVQRERESVQHRLTLVSSTVFWCNFRCLRISSNFSLVMSSSGNGSRAKKLTLTSRSLSSGGGVPNAIRVYSDCQCPDQALSLRAEVPLKCSTHNTN